MRNSYQIEKRALESLLMKTNVPIARRQCNTQNMEWFLRQGVLYCQDRNQYEEALGYIRRLV